MSGEMVELSIPEVFERVAHAAPANEAICSERSSLTYQAAQELANRVAHAAIESGVRPGDRVVLLFSTCPEAVAALLGVVKSGAIAVPLNGSTSEAQLQRLVEDAEPACIVTDAASRVAAMSIAQGGPVLECGALGDAPVRDWPKLDPGAPAVMLYTSGSTGRPKGVLQSHRSTARKIADSQLVLRTQPGDRVTLFSTYAVGQGMTAIFSALLNGATVCMFDVRTRGFDRLVEWLVEQRITIYISSATLFRSLARTSGERLRCPDLRLVRLGSERVTPADVEAGRRTFPTGVTLVIAYSSTETSTVAMHVVDPAEQFHDGLVPVGRPLPGLRVSILDDDGATVPAGQIGEIAVHGRALPLGYWRDTELTASRYQESPDVPGERRVLTGDLGRLCADGRLVHLGRKDRRVKVRGFRIELDEVEHVLSQHPAVTRTAVAALPDKRGDLTLVAYVEGAQESIPVDDLRRFLAERLVDYKVPSTFIALARLPMSDSGKILRSELPSPDAVRPLTAASHAAPQTELQRVVAAVWADVLGQDAIGLDDSFFMVGGDSLRAAQIASRLSTALGVEVPMTVLLETETIRQLAEQLEKQVLPSGQDAASSPLPRG